MRKKDVKIGMKVRNIDTGDEGVVTGMEEYLAWVKWTITQNEHEQGQELYVAYDKIEAIAPDEEVVIQEDHGSFKINQKVKKVVTEIKEAESFTITLSVKAAHELRALMGACTYDSSLSRETQELCDYLYYEDEDNLLTFSSPFRINFDKAKKWTKVR